MKFTVLFVDDEPNMIEGLKRMLRSMRNEWGQYFAHSGQEALEVIAENHIDILVSDMRMPEMDGTELLAEIRRLYPQTIRVILSGLSDQEAVFQSARTAHRFLSKPCNAETLKHTLDRLFRLRHLINDEKLETLVVGTDLLPSMPHIYIKLLQELNSPDISFKRVGDIISQDMSMSAKVLQLVNSAYFSIPQKVSSPHHAVTLLGLNLIKSLVLYVKIFSIHEKEGKEATFLDNIWRHSMKVSTLAKKIAVVESAGQQTEDDCFIAGLLHDAGKLLLLKKPGYRQQVLKLMKENNCRHVEAEHLLLGTSHAQVGAYLMGLWALPDNIVEAVAYHHIPSEKKDDTFSELTAVHIANALLEKETLQGSDEKTKYPKLDHDYVQTVRLKNSIQELAHITLQTL